MLEKSIKIALTEYDPYIFRCALDEFRTIWQFFYIIISKFESSKKLINSNNNCILYLQNVSFTLFPTVNCTNPGIYAELFGLLFSLMKVNYTMHPFYASIFLSKKLNINNINKFKKMFLGDRRLGQISRGK